MCVIELCRNIVKDHKIASGDVEEFNSQIQELRDQGVDESFIQETAIELAAIQSYWYGRYEAP
jgi:hypothetical protein